MTPKFSLLIPLLLSFGLAACGGSSNSNNAPTPPPATSSFTQAAEWDITPQQGESYCYDIISQTQNSCESDWDIKFVMDGRTPAFYTNSGASGEGKGGALDGPFDYDWSTLKKFPSGLVDDQGESLVAAAYLVDSLDNAFAGDNSIGSQVLEYGVSGHLLLPNYSVILVTDDNTSESTDDTYAVQFTGYYGGNSGSESGHPTLRWAKVGSSQGEESTATIDASQGQWVHFDLGSGAIVDAPNGSNWHLAFNRYNIKTNSGASGEGKVGTFLAAVPVGFYDEEGNPISNAFLNSEAPQDTLPLLFDEDAWEKPSKASDWKTDTVKSSLNPAYVAEIGPEPGPGGMKMQMNYGWYRYYSGIEGHTDHTLAAAPENGVMLRARDGETYARLHLTTISYENTEDASSDTTWTFELDIAPK